MSMLRDDLGGCCGVTWDGVKVAARRYDQEGRRYDQEGKYARAK
jgi:hypothetical protein